MINILELRIGNKVLDPYGNEREVTGFRGSKVYLLRPNGPNSIYSASEISPVPLTKERLFSFGAKLFGDGLRLELNNRLIDYAECRNTFYDVPTGVNLVSVHQLSNLYFALTGQELREAPVN